VLPSDTELVNVIGELAGVLPVKKAAPRPDGPCGQWRADGGMC
jgi:hypothetical protein